MKRHSLQRAFFALCTIGLCGCSLLAKRENPTPLASSLQEIVPHSDRDHFVYVWRRVENGRVAASGIQVEHVTTIGNGEFEMTLSEDGMAMGRMRFRDEGNTLVLLREDDLVRGFRFTYEPPLAQLQMPLFPGKQQASASATMTRSTDAEPLAVVPVTQVVDARSGPAVHSRVGDFRSSVVIQTVRTLRFPDESSEMQAETVLVPGIGEISSTGSVSDSQVLHRELACAIIGGRPLGDCRDLNKIVGENNDAGPSDVR